MELPGALFSPSWKNKKNPPLENFLCPNIKNFIYIFSAALIFQETEPPQKKFLYCLKRKLFLYFGKRKPPKNIYVQETVLSYISWKGTFRTRKKKPTLKKCLKFREIELSSSKLKKIPIFQEWTCKIRRKTNKKIRSEEPFNISPKKVFLTSRCWLSRKMKIFWLQDDYFS